MTKVLVERKMKELEYTKHEDTILQHLIDEEKPIYDKYRKKFRELAEEFYEEFHEKRKENFYGFNHCHVCSFELSCSNEKEAHKCCREYLRQIGKEDTIETIRYGFLHLKKWVYTDYCDYCPYDKYMVSDFDGNVLFIHGWEDELEKEKFGEPL